MLTAIHQTLRLIECSRDPTIDRKSTRLNSSHMSISYAVFCLKKSEHGVEMHLNARARGLNEDGNSLRIDKGDGTTLELPSDQVLFFLRIGRPPRSTLFPNTALFR